MAYASSTTYLLTRLPHAGLYDYNGMQIDFFIWDALIEDRLTGPGLMSLWNGWGWC